MYHITLIVEFMTKRNTITMNKEIVLCLLGLFMFTSCLSIKGLDTGYGTLTEAQKGRVLKYDGNIETLRYDGKVYKITANQMKQYVSLQDCVLVYDYKPHCSEKYCVNPSAVEKYCQQHNCKFCLVACDLDGIFDTSLFESPLLFMDNEAYGTHLQSKYESRFLEDLTGKTYKERGYGRFLLFRHGLYVGTYDSYTDVFNPNI